MGFIRLALLLAGASLVLVVSAQELLRSPQPVAPGNATPQPYVLPQVRPLGVPRDSPPLLDTGQQRRAQPNARETRPDPPIPALEEQLRRNRERQKAQPGR